MIEVQQIAAIFERNDVQDFVDRIPGVCNSSVCGGRVNKTDDSGLLFVLSWAIGGLGGRMTEQNLRILNTPSHHIMPIRRGEVPGNKDPEAFCYGSVSFRALINTKSPEYDADFAEYVRIVQARGIVRRASGLWGLGD